MNKNNQTYISDELTHFVGGNKESVYKQYETLKKIISEKCLRHGNDTPDDHNKISVNKTNNFSDNKLYCPHVVCFCDIPKNSFDIHTKKYGKVGLSFKKEFVAKNGGSPVFYIPIHAKRIGDSTGPRGEYFDSAVETFHKYYESQRDCQKKEDEIFTPSKEPNDIDFDSLKEVYRFFVFYIFSYAKFFDHTLSEVDENNYYFEREWRIIGKLNFNLEDICHIYMPEEYHKEAKMDDTFKDCIDKIKSI